ncbi:MAG: 16S rRNA (cytidine(1402)-2'-O)-methyltransferase [Actinomycetota bacterium]
MSGRVFICATPIGNLEDVTFRLLRVLSEASLIAAEDTRHTRKLLTHHGVKAKLISYHDHNENTQLPYLLEQLGRGSTVALVTDGGMPGVSDPGYKLVLACVEQGIPVEVIPGPSAVLAALVLSGLPIARFCFEGFLPRKAGDQRRRLEALALDDRTIVIFESPKRVRATLGLMMSVFGDRKLALCRELTKVHEQVLRGAISDVIAQLPEQLKGEIVLVVEGKQREKQADHLLEATQFARQLLSEGIPKSRSAAEAAALFSTPRRAIYEALLKDPGSTPLPLRSEPESSLGERFPC